MCVYHSGKCTSIADEINVYCHTFLSICNSIMRGTNACTSLYLCSANLSNFCNQNRQCMCIVRCFYGSRDSVLYQTIQ